MCGIDLNNLLSLRGDALTRGHQYKVMQERCTNNYRKNFLVQLVARFATASHQLLISTPSPDSNCL